MLLKYSQLQKRSKLAGSGKPQRSSGNVKAVNGKGKGHRKAIKTVASKRIKAAASRREEVYPVPLDPCDNSNDSGLGFDHHLDFQVPRTAQTHSAEPEYFWSDLERNKRQRVDIKLESDNANDNFTFPHTPRTLHPPSSHRVGKAVPSGKGLKRGSHSGLGTNIGFSRDGKVQLVIVSQPEMQHRARYQTEGSRGAVKDRTGNGFPIVKLIGYDKPAILEVYIGTDQGREAPHMFYQACRVSGKNSTPCVEKNVNGTVLIEIEFDPAKDMTVMCDCVGILKERNVDVEHRFPEESTARNKKKSTRCRMVFRTVITNGENQLETLQVTSQPIICTQPPGVPEICKKSVVSCHTAGGLELFVLGKNFLKDTRVVFSEGDITAENYWEAVVQPDKEFLQQSHLVCTIPPYKVEDIKEPVVVKLSVVSSGRSSEPHTFVYTPLGTPPLQALPREPMVAARAALAHCVNQQPVVPFTARNLLLGIPLVQLGSHSTVPAASFVQPETPKCKEDPAIHPVMLMPPPAPAMLPAAGLPSQTMGTILDGHIELKREVETPPTENVTPDLSISQATIRQFVSSTPLPSLSVENFLSNIESTTTTSASQVPITSQKPYGETNMSASDQMASLKNQIAVSIANEVQVASKLDAFVKSNADAQLSPTQMASLKNQNQIAVSMANEAQVASKLDAFVKSNADASLSPNGEAQSTLPGASDGELIIGVPQQTSPLNLNTHESMVTSLNPSHLMLEQKIPTRTQNDICSILSEGRQSQTLTMPSQMMSSSLSPDATNEMLINPNFSPGKKMLVNVTDGMNVDQLTSPEFSEMGGSSTVPTTTSNLLMKVDQVMKDLNQSSHFSSHVIHTSVETPSQVGPIPSTIMVSPGYMNTQTDLMRVSSNSFLSSQPIHLKHKDAIQNELQSLSAQQFDTAMMNTCVSEQAQSMNAAETSAGHDASSSSSDAHMVVEKNPSYSGNGSMTMDNHFSSTVMSLPMGPNVTDVKTLRTEVSTFADNLVFSNAEKLSVVTTEQMSLGTATFSDVTNGAVELNNNQFATPSFQSPPLNQQENGYSQASLMSSQNQTSDLTLPADGENMSSGATRPSYQNCSLVESFTSQPPPPPPHTTTGFITVPPSNPSVVAASTDKDQTRETTATAVRTTSVQQVKKCEDGMPLPHELTNMSEHDLLSYINPSCFDTV